ncbi:MAG TPA: class I SAM-dependent methyltransferase [Planctomycetaceae bacterium]|jgi:SAM-dependent methyltransferase|nr:class I SAM-dependent methyltransferase [Planctomycetaceae bacterium]
MSIQRTADGAVSNPAPNYAAIKKTQQATWAGGDFSVVASRIVYQAEQLCETADLQSGWRVLDVATGSGNAALAAARRGCDVVGIDYVPALLDRGRIRATAEHLAVDFVEGDAESLPCEDASFDAVISIYGVMFAPHHERAAAELARVCRPGGRIALACWTPDGFIGETFRLFSRYLPSSPGLVPPVRWGEEAYQRELFGDSAASVTSYPRTAIFRFRSAEENVNFFRTYYGPTLRAFEVLAPELREDLYTEMVSLAQRYDRNGGAGPIAIRADYLETVITRA